MKSQAWILLLLTSATFGAWQHSTAAGAFFFFGVLLIGTVVTAYVRWSNGLDK